MLPRAILRRQTGTWSGNTLLAIAILIAGLIAVVLLFALRQESAKAVCERLGRTICHDPLPVVSVMAAYMPMYAVFAPTIAIGALFFRNSVVAHVEALEPVFVAFAEEDTRNICLSGAAANCNWCPALVRALTTYRLDPNPFHLARAVRVFADLSFVGLSGLALVSLAHSFYIHNFLSSAFFFFGYAMVVGLLVLQAQLRGAFPERMRSLLGDETQLRARVKVRGLVLLSALLGGLFVPYWTITNEVIVYGYLRAMIQYTCLAGLVGFAGVIWADWRSLEQEQRIRAAGQGRPEAQTRIHPETLGPATPASYSPAHIRGAAGSTPVPITTKISGGEGQGEECEGGKRGGGTGVLCVAPTVKENVPASNSVHDWDPASSLYLLASHDVQAGAVTVLPNACEGPELT